MLRTTAWTALKIYVKEASYDFTDRVGRAVRLIRTKGRMEIARAGGGGRVV